jgi:hypothetical protein
MDIDVFTRSEHPAVFRALRTALNPRGELEAHELRFLETYARITGYRGNCAALAPISPAETAIAGQHQRKRMLQLAAIAALLHHPVRRESLDFLKGLSEQLGVRDPVIDVIEALIAGRKLKVRMLAMRRAMRALFKEAYLSEGVRGVWRFFSAMFLGTRVNQDRMWNFKRLGLLPEGTLGREYWKHLTKEGFGFPGEPGGIPESVSYHDVAHVLAGNDTSPLGEIQQGSFQGGNRREDGFFFIQFVILHFHHGVKVTPAAPAQLGNFHPEKVLWAIHRGAECPVDMTHQWNYWALMEMKLEHARNRVGLLPHLDEVNAAEAALRRAA